MALARPIVLILVLLAGPLAAQRAPAPRPGTDRVGLHFPRLRAICTPVVHGQRGSYPVRARLLDSLDRVHPADSLRLGAACLRTLLFLDIDRTEPLNAKDAEEIRKAILGFADLLRTHPGHPLASEALALMALELSSGAGVRVLLAQRNLVAERIYGAVRAGVTEPSVLRACTRFALLVGDTPTGRFCMRNGLVIGSDSTWYLIHSAWLSLLHGETPIAMQLVATATAAAHTADARGDLDNLQRMIEKVRREAGDTAAVSGDDDNLAEALARAGARADFLGGDFARCPPSFMRNGARLGESLASCLVQQRDTTTRDIDVTAAVYHLWDPQTLAPQALLTIDMPRGDLVITTEAGGRSAVGSLTLRQFEWESELWRDTTWTAYRIPLATSGDRSHVAAAMLVPPFAGQGSWSVAFSQLHRFGRAALDGLWPLDVATIALSDLIVGERAQGLSFPVGTEQVTLAPRDALGSGKTVELWFQVLNHGPRRDLQAAFVLRRIADGQIARVPALSLATGVAVPPGLSSIEREISLKEVKRGDYQLVVELRDGNGGVVARRAANLYLR